MGNISEEPINWLEDQSFVTRRATFENLFAEGVIHNYDGLPNHIDSGAIETYANSLAASTVSDPRKMEYGGWVHLHSHSRQLWYPTPVRGTIGSYQVLDRHKFYAQVKPAYISSEDLHPVINAHSHPNFSPFSDHDMYLMFGIDNQIRPQASILGTWHHNFLMLASQETIYSHHEEILGHYYLSENAANEEGHTYFDRLQKIFPVWEGDNDVILCDICDLYFGGDVAGFYGELKAIISLCERQKAGFYYSRKDGQYIRLTEENLPSYMEGLLQEAIDAGKRQRGDQ